MNTVFNRVAVYFAAYLGSAFVLCLGIATTHLTAAEATVTTTPELASALATAQPGDEIRVRAGVYSIAQPVRVPDGVTLFGDGVMLFDAQGMPAGFALAGQTILQAESTLTGDMITLGHGSILGALIIRDTVRTGSNVVAVSTRGPGDTIFAGVVECEISNPNGNAVGPQGPTGRALAVTSRNPNMAAPPSPDDDASVRVSVRRSVIHTPLGAAVFANNFASRCAITLDLVENLIGGAIDIVGGTSRPDPVTDSSATVLSHGNLYRCEGPPSRQPAGWSIMGGATPPIALVAGISTRNAVHVVSTDDRIEGFPSAVVATGGQRYFPNSGPVVGNHTELLLHCLRLDSTLADLHLTGGRSAFDGNPSDANADNSLSVTMTRVVGSGARQNVYSHQIGVWPGNHLKVTGNPTSFGRVNESIEPPPPPEFFASGFQ